MSPLFEFIFCLLNWEQLRSSNYLLCQHWLCPSPEPQLPFTSVRKNKQYWEFEENKVGGVNLNLVGGGLQINTNINISVRTYSAIQSRLQRIINISDMRKNPLHNTHSCKRSKLPANLSFFTLRSTLWPSWPCCSDVVWLVPCSLQL